MNIDLDFIDRALQEELELQAAIQLSIEAPKQRLQFAPAPLPRITEPDLIRQV